jgi:basic membrane lipoprotein Med (substrate-binding protein (PBP1-ABC) superfamily)
MKDRIDVKRLTAVLLLSASIALGSCSERGLLVFMADPYVQSLGGGSSLKSGLSAVAGKYDMHLDLLVSGIMEPVDDVLSRRLSRTRAAAVVVGPLFSIEAAQLAGKFPQVRFILMGGPSSSETNGNVLRLLFDRREAFQTMGYASALSLKEETVGAGSSPSGQAPAGGAGVLLPRSRIAADEEVDAFSRGFKQAAGASRLIVQDLNEPIDGETVRKAVRDMRAQGVEIFLPVLGESNEACLEAVRNSGGCVVTADWEGTGAFANQVFLSVEEDVAAGIDASLAAASDTGIVYGPVRVVSGRARSVPPELKEKIVSR